MQSIERYGVVALLFLVVTVIAVLVWDADAPLSKMERVANAATKNPSADLASDVAGTESSRRVKLKSPPIRSAQKPLTRELAEKRKREKEAARKEAEALATGAESKDFGVRELDQGAAPAGIVKSDRGTTVASKTKRKPRRGGRRNSIGAVESTELARETDRAKAQPTRSTRARTYTIAAGDTLSEIAMKELGTMKRWREIVELNPELDPAKLAVGQKLRLPLTRPSDGVAASASAAPKTRKAKADDGSSYVVQSGDSLWRIAKRALGDGDRWGEIAQLNPALDANRLRPGQKLRLPNGAASTRAAVSAAAPIVADANSSGSSTRGRVR